MRNLLLSQNIEYTLCSISFLLCHFYCVCGAILIVVLVCRLLLIFVTLMLLRLRQRIFRCYVQVPKLGYVTFEQIGMGQVRFGQIWYGQVRLQILNILQQERRPFIKKKSLFFVVLFLVKPIAIPADQFSFSHDSPSVVYAYHADFLLTFLLSNFGHIFRRN